MPMMQGQVLQFPASTWERREQRRRRQGELLFIALMIAILLLAIPRGA
jgi:hypothetical protein